MSNLTTFFGGGSSSSGGSTSAINATSYARFKRLEFLATATSISGVNGYMNTVFAVAMNDTHFVVHYQNNNNQSYHARLFRLNDDYTVTAIGSWLELTGTSGGDLSGVATGNGYRSCFIGYRSSSNNRITHFSWDGSTGTSQSNVVNTQGSDVGINNCSCLIDGTLVGQVHNSNSNIYWATRTLAGASTSGNSSSAFNGSASVSGSVGMESSVHSVGKIGSSDLRLYQLYRGNNGSFYLNSSNIDHNQSHVYQPTSFKIARSGNGVVVAIDKNESNRYGATMVEGYASDSTSGFQWHRVNHNYGYGNGYGYSADNTHSRPTSQLEGQGSFCRQYNGTYLDAGYIPDFGDDTRFKVSYPYKYLSRQSTTSNYDSIQRQCMMGDKVIQVHRIGNSNGSYSLEFDFWKLT